MCVIFYMSTTDLINYVNNDHTKKNNLMKKFRQIGIVLKPDFYCTNKKKNVLTITNK